ncbi:MAG: ABC transporter substrate-binding protein [Chloroflexi bacterium]|nr:ABC transporter substrate-binding protein [Chloroflexota bacterium]
MRTCHIFATLASIVAFLIVSCAPAAAPAPTAAPTAARPAATTAPAAAPTTAAAPAATTAPAPAATTAPAPAAKPDDAAKKTLIIAAPRDLLNLDPTSTSSDALVFELQVNVYARLINFKVQKDASGELVGLANEFVPEVAESFEFTDGGKKLVFKLRKGIKFSNGDPIDAAAVKFTYDRIFDTNTTAATLNKIAQITSKDSVKIIDDSTVEMTIDKPNPLVLGNLALAGNAILNPKVIKPYMTAADPQAREWLKANTKGTEAGPYLLESWKPGVEWVLAKNPNWWGRQPQIERIVYRVVPDPSTRLTLLKSGAVDIAKDLAFKDLRELETDQNVKVYRFTSNIVSFLGMNAKKAPFDNVKVRQAINYAVPYDTIIKNVLYGYGSQLKSVAPTGMPTFTDEFFVYKTDPAKAKALLAEAGYPNGLKVTFAVRADIAESKAVGVWVKSELAKAGIDVTIQEMDGAAFTAALQKHEHAFFHHFGWLSNNNDPFYHYSWLLQSECCNYTDWKNAEVDELITKFTASNDLPARNAASKRIQELAVKDAVWTFLYMPDITLATRKNLKNVVYYAADRFWRYIDTVKE